MCRILSILYVRFLKISWINRATRIFQFSMWDSHSRHSPPYGAIAYFQFSMWDSQKCRPNYRSCKNTTFNSLCEIPQGEQKCWLVNTTTFNSLCEIQGCSSCPRTVSMSPFNSLCEILEGDCGCVCHKRLSILYVRFCRCGGLLLCRLNLLSILYVRFLQTRWTA